MKITRLSLVNFRGIRTLSLDFHEKLNVFFGVNGAGKSAVLDAVAIMFSQAVARIGHSGASRRHINEKSDITNKKPFSTLELFCESGSREIEWKLVKSRKGHSTRDERSTLTGLNEFAKGLREQITECEENVNLPLFVYYPVNRAVLDIPLRIRDKHSFDLLAAYEGALTSGANFRTFLSGSGNGKISKTKTENIETRS